MLTSPNLFATQVRILGMGFTAERALHDTYLRIWLKSSEYSEQLGAPMPWLTSIARNHALNLKRARLADGDQDAYMDDTIEVDAEYIDTTFLSHYPDSKPIKRCLDELDINTSDAIVRAYLDGWSLEQLSDAYNKPVESLKASIHAAMLTLGAQV